MRTCAGPKRRRRWRPGGGIRFRPPRPLRQGPDTPSRGETVMRLPLLAASMIGAALFAAASARAADMVPPQPPAYEPPPVAEAPPPMMVQPPPVVAVAPAGPAGCWRYGPVGWGWYPCVAGPPPYWHGYRYGYGYGYGYGYRGRPYWARSHYWHRSYW